MTSISNVDRIMLLVRGQLERAARNRKSGQKARTSTVRETTASNQPPLPTFLAEMEIGDRDFDRVVVRALLIEEFGEALSNDPAFERICAQTRDILADDAEWQGKLDEIRKAIRK